jgi:hypothetical protein
VTNSIKNTRTLYEQVIGITEEYLGPAADRFIARQISFHLGKQPQNLMRSDLPKLIEWARITLSLLTEDTRLVDEYVEKLTELAKQ